MRAKKLSRHDKLLKFLKNKASYPHKPKTLRHIQTHSSDVFIVPPYVYKVKKSVNLRFLDFSSLSKRKYYCEREVELNRRLTDGIYLGVEKILLNKSKLTFGSGKKVIEYAVKMKRLPEKYFIKNLLKKGQVNKQDFVNIIVRLVKFYKGQPSNTDIDKFGSSKSVKFTIDQNFELSKRFIGKTISSPCYDAVKLYNNLFFKKNSKLFKQRTKLGFIKDCHGDLHLEHINLAPQELNIFDCIEFNNRFRYIDIASDLAFLAMDLDFNGYKKYGDLVVSEFSKKIKDKTIYKIIDFYKCYRAYVRGKVESIRSESKDVSRKEREISSLVAKKYFNLALNYALFGSKPIIIVVFGFIASGKSTLAELISNELSAVVISSDKTRKEITGTKLTERNYEGFNKGIYAKEITEKTYIEMYNRCTREIILGKSVILDASFSKKRYRKKISNEAKKIGAEVFFIETEVSEKVIKRRLQEREKTVNLVSDARMEIFTEFKKSYEEVNELSTIQYIRINTDASPEKVVTTTFNKLIKMRFKH